MAFIVGTSGNDTIRTAAAGGSLDGVPDATDTGDVITAGAGGDIIVAGNGSDTITGGAGQDQILAGDGNDIIVVIDYDLALAGQASDVAFGEEVDGGDGNEDTLFLAYDPFLTGDTPTYDLTSWLIRDVDVLEFGYTPGAGEFSVSLTDVQLAGFDAIIGRGATLRLSDDLGAGATFSLFGKLLGSETPVTRVVLDSPEPDVLVLDHVGTDVIMVEGGANDVFYIPGLASDYLPFSPGASSVPVFAADGTQLYEILGGGLIFFVNDTPLSTNDDPILATIDAGAVNLDFSRLLANDSGAGILVTGPDTASLTDQGGFLFPTGSPLQRFDYQPPAGFNGVDSVTYEITDVLGNTATGTVFFSVTNTAPVAPNLSLTLAPGAVIRAEDLVALVTDADNDGILFAGFGFDPAGLQLQIVTVPGSSLPGAMVSPIAGQSTAVLRYIVFDDSGAIGNIVGADITITFTGTGGGIARDDALRGTIGGTDSVNVSALTVNDDAGVTITGLVGATALSATEFRLETRDPVTNAIDATITFDSVNGEIAYTGLDDAFTFAYEAVDGVGNISVATVTVTVDNNTPQPVDLTFAMQPGVARTFQWADIVSVNSDPDGDQIALASYGPISPAFAFNFIDPAWGTFSANFDEFTIMPFAGATGPQSFFYQLLDQPDLGGAQRTLFGTDRGTLTFTLPSGPPPVFRLEPVVLSVNEGTPPPGDTSFTGMIGGFISFDLVRVSGGDDAAQVYLTVLGGGTNPATPDDLFAGMGDFVAFIPQGVDRERVEIVVKADALAEGNETFVVALTSASVGTVETTSFTATIVDDDARPPPVFSLLLSENVMPEGTGAGNGGFIAFTVQRDPASDLGAATVLVSVAPFGANPIDGDDLFTGFSGIVLNFADGQEFATFSLQASPDALFEPDETLSVALANTTLGTVNSTPITAVIANDDLPPPEFALRLNENVEAEGSPPFGGGGIGFRIERTSGAADAATLTLSVGTGTVNPATADDIVGGFRTFTVTISEGEDVAFFPLFATPDTLFENDESLSVALVSSTVGTVGTTPVTAVIFNDDAPENRAPVAANDSFTARPGQLLTIAGPGLLANDSDPDGDAIIAAQFSQGAQGGVVTLVTDGSFTYTPPAGFAGTDTFTYRIFDGVLFSDLATVTIAVVNALPVAANDSFTVQAGQVLTIAAPGVLGNDTDSDGDQLSVLLITDPVDNGRLILFPDGNFTYTPTLGFSGVDSFRYRISDGFGGIAEAVVTINVIGANAAPTDIVLTNAAVLENLPAGTLIGLLSATDPDAGDSLAFSFAPGSPGGGNAGGLFRIDGNRLLTDAVLDHEAAATPGITLRVTDSAGNTYDEAFTIAVGDVAEGGPVDPVQPVIINGPGFSVSNGNAATPATATPGGPSVGTGTLTPLVDTAPITLPGEAGPRARIENESNWDGLKNLVLGQSFWTPGFGTDVLLANFVDVRWDLSTAPALDFDLLIAGGKRGAVILAGGDDALTWVFHSNEGTWNNTATIAGGAGDDTLAFTTVGLSTIDNALLADNANPANGPLWNAAYDGRFSTAVADGGLGDDVISAAARVRLVADGGVGNDVLTGGARNDSLRGGDGNDMLTGGLGADRFLFDANDGIDAIADFSRAQGDRVVLEGPGTLAFSGSGFTFGATTVTATNAHTWSAADFLFA